MDVFLIGYRPSPSIGGPGDLRTRLASAGHGARAIRDWSALTTDDTLWHVVLDTPDALSVRAAADELGLEIIQAMRLVPDRPLGGHVDGAETMVEILPTEPSPTLGDIIRDQGDWSGV